MKKDKKTDEPDVMISMRVLPNEQATIAGSVIGECKECRQPIWVSPSSQKILGQRRVDTYCSECGLEKMKAEGDSEIAEITQEQLDEIRAVLPNIVARREKKSQMN